MAAEIEEIARLLGARIVGQMPDAGGGAPGAAALAGVYQARMSAIREQAGGRPAAPDSVHVLEVPVSDTVARALSESAEFISTAGEPITPTMVATALLSGAVLQWMEPIRRLQARLEEVEKSHEELRRQVLKEKRDLHEALLKMSGVSERQAAG
jgi:hypothetical protein